MCPQTRGRDLKAEEAWKRTSGTEEEVGVIKKSHGILFRIAKRGEWRSKGNKVHRRTDKRGTARAVTSMIRRNRNGKCDGNERLETKELAHGTRSKLT